MTKLNEPIERRDPQPVTTSEALFTLAVLALCASIMIGAAWWVR